MFPPPDQLLASPLKTEVRILVGTGPSTVNQHVLSVMARPLMGPIYPETFAIMDEIKDGCRYIFQTQNKMTLCLSTSGHGGMEASLSNLIERDDTVLIGVTGLWGQRAADMAQRYGANVRLLKAAQGMALTLDSIEEGLRLHRPTLLFLVHGDTSTGILQSLEGVGQLCRRFVVVKRFLYEKPRIYSNYLQLQYFVRGRRCINCLWNVFLWRSMADRCNVYDIAKSYWSTARHNADII